MSASKTVSLELRGWLSGQGYLLCKPNDTSAIPGIHRKVEDPTPQRCPSTSACVCYSTVHPFTSHIHNYKYNKNAFFNWHEITENYQT